MQVSVVKQNSLKQGSAYVTPSCKFSSDDECIEHLVTMTSALSPPFFLSPPPDWFLSCNFEFERKQSDTVSR